MSALDPIVVWLGDVPIRHGERDDSEACLCGYPCYYRCPEWLFGDNTVASIVFRATEGDAS